tara:strand:- start:1888 stop:2223 length:336 start_codon:yes stop_codon:yes gene_type:complete
VEVLPLLHEWLQKNSSKVMTLFRKWDTDENGEVSVLEFKQASRRHDHACATTHAPTTHPCIRACAQAMHLLGLKAADTDIARLFASFDPDGSGAIDFRELNKALRVYAAWP